MKKLIVICMLLLIPGFTGCGGETATGLAIGGGISEVLRETIKGGKADLARKKAELIEAYNVGVEQGMEVEELDELKRKIANIEIAEKGVETGETFFGIDWKNPNAADITALVEFGLILFGAKKLNTTTKKYTAEKKGIAKALTKNGGTVDSKTVYASIAEERQKLKLPSG